MKKLKHITEICSEIYENEGAAGVYDYIIDAQKNNETHVKNVKWKECDMCDAETPHWGNNWSHQCLVCGTLN